MADSVQKSPIAADRSDLSDSFARPSQNFPVHGGGPVAATSTGMNHSMARSSFITDKSFRVPGGRHRVTKTEAAVTIQKNYRRHRNRQDFKLAVNRQLSKRFLFKVTTRSNEQTKVLTCSLKSRECHGSGQIEGLTFVLSDSVRSASPVG